MSIFFWILGIIAAVAASFPLIWWVVNRQVEFEWEDRMKKLKADRKFLDEQRQELQGWYSGACAWVKKEEAEIKEKEKEFQALKAQLSEQIIKNNQEKEQFLQNYKFHLKHYEECFMNLKYQLEQARQRSKRFAKQAKKSV